MRFVIASFVSFTVMGLAVVEAGSTLLKKEEIPQAIQRLRRGSAKERAFAAEQLGHRGAIRSADVKDAVAPLREVLRSDKDVNVRQEAARALGNIGRELEETVPALVESMKNDKAMPVRLAAIAALGQIGPEARAATPELRKIAAEKKTNKQLSRAARMALKSIGGRTK
jgi:hypothetical protein